MLSSSQECFGQPFDIVPQIFSSAPKISKAQYNEADLSLENLRKRNVADRYKQIINEEISKDMAAQAMPIAIFSDYLESDRNFGAIIRVANAVCVEGFHYLYHRKRVDTRSAVSAHKYLNVVHHYTVESVAALKDKYHFVALENNIPNKTKDIGEFNFFGFDKPVMICVGTEGKGLNLEILALCDDYIQIPIRGSIRSLNVSIAAGIMLYKAMEQYEGNKERIVEKFKY